MRVINEMFDEVEEFESLLEDAESNANSRWAQDFVDDIANKYDTYKENMFLSEKQEEILRRIAYE